MKKSLLIAMTIVFSILSACSGNDTTTSTPASEEEVQETVQNFYNEISKLDQLGKSSLEKFNSALTSYSAGEVTDKQLAKAINQFQSTASDLSEKTEEVEISGSLPENIRKLLQESIIAFQSAYDLKEKASKGADSPEVSAEQFNELNQNADLAMLVGISKLNEARAATGLIDAETETEAVTGTSPE